MRAVSISALRSRTAPVSPSRSPLIAFMLLAQRFGLVELIAKGYRALAVIFLPFMGYPEQRLEHWQQPDRQGGDDEAVHDTGAGQ